MLPTNPLLMMIFDSPKEITTDPLSMLWLFPLTAAAGLLNPLAYPLAVCPMLLLIVVMGYQRGNMLPGMHMEFIVESIFILSGLLAFIFTLAG